MRLRKKIIVRTSPEPIDIPAYRNADLDPDSRPPTNVFQKFMSLLHSFLLWTKTAEALVRLIISSIPVEVLMR